MVQTPDGRETVKITLTGIGPMLTHSTAGMDPMNPIAVEISALTSKPPKEKKLLPNIIALQQAEWKAGLYMAPEGKDGALVPCLPTTAILGCIRDAAKSQRLGSEVTRSVDLDAGAFVALNYEGPKTLAGMWADHRFRYTTPVVIGRVKVLRTRPKFDEWSVDLTMIFDAEFMRRETLLDIVRLAGRRVGVGDYRPRFGRFALTAIDGIMTDDGQQMQMAAE